MNGNRWTGGLVASVLIVACGDSGVGATTESSSGTGEETATTGAPTTSTTAATSDSTGAAETTGSGSTDASSTAAVTATETAGTTEPVSGTGSSTGSSTGGDTTGTTGGDTTGGDTTGGDTTGVDTTGGSTGGGDTTGGVEPLTCDVGEWTCVPVEPDVPYGTRSFKVLATQNWVNTGLYLKAGEKATITVDGTWAINNNDGKPIDHGPCLIGDFVARIGLLYKDNALNCVAGQATITADKPGILFVGALPSNDLGETYETRLKATGVKDVTVTSAGATVPFIAVEDAATYPYDLVASGWVEISGKHTILTLPTDTTKQDAASLATAVDLIDTFYELHFKMRGALPQHGQRIRWIADANVKQFAYMLAGNPVRMDPILVSKGFAHRISIAGKPGVDVWGFAHELGHDFTFPNAVWWYQEKTLESWPNLFSVHALEQLGIPLHPEYLACPGSPPVNYASWDPWDGLCFLMQFKYLYGWEHYYAFFTTLNATPANQVPSGPAAWTFVHNVFEAVAKKDVTPVFQAWGVPNPG